MQEHDLKTAGDRLPPLMQVVAAIAVLEKTFRKYLSREVESAERQNGGDDKGA
ncbi:hypothetical protein D3C78_1193530 [compost metagenome]